MGELKEKTGGLRSVGLSGDALKWIAMVTMFIDHLAHTSLNPYGPHYVEIYTAMRTIGRVAFPIYCFLLVEGFMHTGNYRRYVLRIGLFALLSEIPFDLAMNGAAIFWNYQSVMVTLLIGLVGLGAYRWCVCSRYPIYGIMVVLAVFGAVFISATSAIGFTDSLYEAVSALATVGLTAGSTGKLSLAGKLLIILYMYFGRVGVLTLSMGFLLSDRAAERIRYAQTNLLIG